MTDVAVILPTRALSERAPLLERAIESVLAQEGARAVPHVIVNGTQADRALVRSLCADSRLRVTVLGEADLTAALSAGRAAVDAPYFAELDDDDVLLPGALALRLGALEEDRALGAVITNGIRRGGGSDTVHIADVAAVRRDPLRTLARENWLLPGSWLCRADAVSRSIFEGMPKYLECTWLALHFATKCRIRILAEPTVVWNTDTPQAMSRSRDCTLGLVPALARILDVEMPDDVRAAFRRKLSFACHDVADLHWHEGRYGDAWSWHLRSLRQPGGWRHLPFALRLLRRS
jgi:glycosyltransferase involved in cell wall biosynthesis